MDNILILFTSLQQGPPITYKLNAVLVHLGSTSNSGHYYCYIKSSNGLWYLMDDDRVIQVNLNQVLDQQAYILFYVRRPAPNNVSSDFKVCLETLDSCNYSLYTCIFSSFTENGFKSI